MKDIVLAPSLIAPQTFNNTLIKKITTTKSTCVRRHRVMTYPIKAKKKSS